MQVGPRLELRQSQHLAMTPQLQQAIRLLQMSRLEAEAFVAGEVERNPLLGFEDGGEAPGAGAPDRAEGVDLAIGRGDPAEAGASLEAGAENLYEAPEPPARPASAAVGLGAPEGGWPEAPAGPPSLRDHLLPQIALAAALPEARRLAALLVGELDEAGYLRADLDRLARALGARAPLIEAAVGVLQACEPAGIGARSLAECLALQLRERGRLDPAMQALLARLDDLAAHRIDRLRAACGVDDEDLAEMIAEIRALDPRPGAAFGATEAPTVSADVTVRRDAAGGWLVELAPEALPKVLYDRSYAARLAAGGGEAAAFAARCRRDADWLVRSLDQRARTILTVATAIVRRQPGFFDDGVGALKPMTLKTVAEEAGVHESTVSRVVANKRLACERGLFELRFFFTQAIPSADGGAALSAEAVRRSIRRLIEAEDAPGALSDDRIVTLLKQSGVELARRTVAKYREGMDIPSSAQRRRQAAARSLGRAAPAIRPVASIDSIRTRP